MTDSFPFFVSCTRGIEDLLAQELVTLGIESVEAGASGVSFIGNLEQAYRVCLWSRLASRVLLRLKQFDASTDQQLYKGVQSINWSQHIKVDGSLAVSCTLTRSDLTNSHYAALKTKDAIVDQFSEFYESRPSVDKEQPDVRVNVHVHNNQANVSIDLSGDPLHRRGYRMRGAGAPLKENLAAAILVRSGWCEQPVNLVDPMCGSATFLIEAAMMVLNIAPAIRRDYFGFLGWKGHKPEIWKRLQHEAREQRISDDQLTIQFYGFDQSRDVIAVARQNIHAAGLQSIIQLEQMKLVDSCQHVAELSLQPGMVIVNPPYGERLGEKRELTYLYADMGNCWREYFADWKVALFTSNDDLSKHVGLRAHRTNAFFNGAIKCKLLQYQMRPALSDEKKQARDEKYQQQRATICNRLKKNFKHLSRWARKNHIQAYRLYDADIPEYSAAVDIYHDWIHVQEYQAPSRIEINRARMRFDLLVDVLPEVTGIQKSNIVVKTRQQQKGLAQYEKQADERKRQVIEEGGLSFYINLTDYLDTGLFIDHRITRQQVADDIAQLDKPQFLNLFAYTGSVSVYAAKAGAITTSVDMSNTYMKWAQRNFELNGIDVKAHNFVRSDCVKWLKTAVQNRQQFDYIFIDPPTFSNSKSMEQVFDVQKDHVFLVDSAMKLLKPQGQLLFSNNFRKFKLDAALRERYCVEDVSASTLPEDFKRNPKIHHCFRLSQKSE